MSTLKVDTILKRTGTGTITLGQSGDTIALGSGASQTGFGGTNTPYFSATRSSGQTISHNTATKIQFNNEVVDSNNNYDNSTNYRFTPTTAGKYLINLTTSVTADANDQYKYAYVYIYKNGSEISSAFSQDNTAYGRTRQLTTHIIADMNGSSDYIEGYVLINKVSGSGNGKVGGGSTNSVFSGYKLID